MYVCGPCVGTRQVSEDELLKGATIVNLSMLHLCVKLYTREVDNRPGKYLQYLMCLLNSSS